MSFSLPAARPDGDSGGVAAAGGPLPHVVAWNLTRRCNLACAHCYISAGSWHAAADELTAAECRRITDEIVELVPGPMFILSGGEPLLRDDLEEIAAYATGRGATVVVGTNGTRLTDARIASLKRAGVTGVAVSVDSLDARYHDRFRHGQGALVETLVAIERLRRHRLDFVVQTTVTRGNRAEIGALAAWAAEKGATSFNLYFLVETGRASGMSGLDPAENDAVLGELAELEETYRGHMLVRAKCQPQFMRHVMERELNAAHADAGDGAAGGSSLLDYATRCPCGVQYCRITPEGKVTPCPYLPEVAGDLRTRSFAEVWRASKLFRLLREGEPGGKCGRCEYRKLCGGCRARAYAEDGDFLGPDTSCAYEPDGRRSVLEPRPMAYGSAAAPDLEWTPAARERMARIPSFVRGVVVRRTEEYARRRGHERVTSELMDEIRAEMPVDFSRRLPFFARAGGRGSGGRGDP